MLGEDMLFVLTECDKEQVYSEGKRIYICCHDPDDQEKVWNLFESWWRKQAKAILQKRAEHWYPIIEKYGVAMPKVAVRKMKTLWGSCSVNRGAITLNFYLIKARMPYIDYVILHELTHFLYPNHSSFICSCLTTCLIGKNESVFWIRKWYTACEVGCESKNVYYFGLEREVWNLMKR